MSAADDARPWWASDDDVSELGPDPDPLDRHRRARRGDGAGPGPASPPPPGPGGEPLGSWWGPAADAVARLGRDLASSAADNAAAADRPWHATEASPHGGRRSDTDEPATGRDDPASADTGARGHDGHRIDLCGVCPICVGLRALGDSRPELVGHLTEAARHLAAAVRAVVDTTAPRSDPDAGARSGPTRIDLDDDPDGWDDEVEP